MVLFERPQKGGAILLPAIVYVLSGGEEREKVYFRNLKNDKMLGSCVQVLFQSKKGQGLQPFQMNDIWRQARKKGKIIVDGKEYRLSKVDKVFLVSDVDEFESQLVSALSTKAKMTMVSGLSVILVLRFGCIIALRKTSRPRS